MSGAGENVVPEVLPVPQEIKDAVNVGRLAVFVGAGVSRLVGCLGWAELAARLVKCCFGERVINFREKDALSGITDHKKVITICHSLLETHKKSEVFLTQMNQALSRNPDSMGENLFDDLIKLRAVFVTTNADRHFDDKFQPSRVYWNPGDFTADRISANSLFHVHGHIDHPETLVFTTRQYLERYGDPKFKEFLRRIFENYTVLFVGYGLSELEVLEVMLQGIPQSGGFRRFMIDAYYRSDTSLLSYERTYFRQLGVELLPYPKDEIGYDKLREVLRHWNREINSTTTFFNQAFSMVDREVR